MSMSYDKDLPNSFQEFTEISSDYEYALKEKIFQLGDNDTWYNEIPSTCEKVYFYMDYIALIYERVAEQYNRGTLSERQRLVKFRSAGKYMVFHSGIYTHEGTAFYVALKEKSQSEKWDLTEIGILSEFDCDSNYESLPEPIDFDDCCQQFYLTYPIEDTCLNNEAYAEIEHNLSPVMRKGITPVVWETAKETLKRDPSKAIPIYRDSKMRFLIPLLYRKSDYVDMFIELTLSEDENKYEVTGFMNPSQAYILARRMGPVRSYWLIKRSGVLLSNE